MVELEVLAGLEPFAVAEVERLIGHRGRHRADSAATEVRFDWSAQLARTLELRTVVAAYLCRTYAIPRPRGLLGDRHMRALLEQLAAAVALHPEGAFESFRFSAAGRRSGVFQRLADAIAEATGMTYDAESGALLIRVRPAGDGWEVLVRLSPRPLSARPWRVVNLPGALNATIAAAMVELTRPDPTDRFLNLMCGSGTLLVERVRRAPTTSARGIDIDGDVVAMARSNLDAAGVDAELVVGDATATALPDRSVDVIVADLPYGHRMGSHDANPALYRAVLAEAHRVAAPGARFAVVTHDLRRFEAALGEDASPWTAESELQVFQKGHHPKVWLLRTRS